MSVSRCPQSAPRGAFGTFQGDLFHMRVKVISAMFVAMAVGTSAHATTNLVTNGGFEQSTAVVKPGYESYEFGASYHYANGVTGWTSASQNAFNVYFVNDGTATTTDADTRFTGGADQQYLWQLPAVSNPNGGNFVALDGDPNYNGAITQTIGGLNVGSQYKLTFYWAAAQYRDRSGATTEQLHVDFGGDTYNTAVVGNPSHGVSGWMTESVIFTAHNASQVLSFLSKGTPAGLPPVALLDGVSLTAVPEPATWALMIAGFGAVGLAARRRRAVAAAAA